MPEENKELDQAKNELISLVSHQLRTPLTTIKWYIETLLSKDTENITEKQKRYLQQIYDSNERMVKLIESLLNVSRLELGTFQIEPEQINIIEIAENTLKELKPQIKEKEITVEKNFEANLSVIEADKKLLGIIFQNLLSNAVKYTENKGKVGLKITIKDSDLFVEVSDNGYGIPAAQHDQIFTKLFRADNVKEKVSVGTGLGLYLVKKIVDQIKGEISFQSAENQGTTFIVRLPLKNMKKN